jgi:Divergent InlB B-repeat domain
MDSISVDGRPNLLSMMRRDLCLLFVIAACGNVPVETPEAGGGAEPQSLTVTVAGPGAVSSRPLAISCGAQCTASFEAGAQVTLTAAPDADAVFLGWSGDCTGAAECTVTLDAARAISASFAAHGSKRWAQQIGFSGQDRIEDLVVDPRGDLIAAGTVDDGGGSDLYIIKYAKEDGRVLWAQRFDTDTGEDLGGLAIDGDGDVYLGTRLSGFGTTATFGAQVVTGDLFGNVVILRLAAVDGAVIWARQWGGEGQDLPEAIAVSGNQLYVAGYTSSNPSQFGDKSLAASTNNGFVVRASLVDGTVSDVKLLAGNASVAGLAVNGGRVAVVGDVRSATTFDRCTLSPSGAGADAMLLDLQGSDLSCQWAKTFGDFVANNNAGVHAVAAYPGGGWVITGAFQGNILLAPSGSSLASRGGFDIFAGRFAADGAHVWSFRYGDIGFDVGYGVETTGDGGVVLAGTFDSTITFGARTLTGARDAFVTRLGPGAAPAHQWAVGLGGNDGDLAEDVALDRDGSVYVLSSFSGMTDVAGSAMTSQDYDAWIGALVR